MMVNKYTKILVALLLCIFSSKIVVAKDDDLVIHYAFAETILLDADEEYLPKLHQGYEKKSKYFNYTITDSSASLVDTLCGTALYWLFYDTTQMASGKELLRTKDYLYLIFGLNRDVKMYSSSDVANAPDEILLADSLIRNALKNKRIWMARYTPYYIPYHPYYVNFMILPLFEDDAKIETITYPLIVGDSI